MFYDINKNNIIFVFGGILLDIESILYEGINRGASDIHLAEGLQPILRINKDLISLSNMDKLSSFDMEYVYRFFIRDNGCR